MKSMIWRRNRHRSIKHSVPGVRSLSIELLEERCLLSASAASGTVNLFGVDIYEHLQREQGNLFFSPLSLSAGLSMTYAGAAGQTATEMAEVLHLGEGADIHDSFKDLITSLLVRTFTVDDFELSTSNAIWPQLGATIHEGFIHTIETNYRGLVQGLDYANPEMAEMIINDWVERETNGKIEDLVDGLSPDTLMVLTNTVYFNSLWDEPFDSESTRPSSFFREAEDEISVTTMFTETDYAFRTSIEGFDILDLPMGDGNASMVLILPLQQNGPNDLTSEVFAGIEEWIEGDRLPTGEMQVQLPKFQTTVETELNELLMGLGMPSAFDPGSANFSSMTDEAIFIKKVFHKATIEVTEQGTEAAAATEVELGICFAAGTPVLTPEGEKPIEQLLVGDIVLARSEHSVEGEVEPKVIEQTKYGLAEIVEVHTGGQVIRTTEAHPFFVEELGWTPAGKILAGSHLATHDGDWVIVDKIVNTGKAEQVYNLRVADYHTFFVGSKAWGFAVWTHNFYNSGFYADHPFHFLIRDNVTSTIAFMGRVDDPTQLQNSLHPSVSGDFDIDGDVDSGDYDVWRSSFGQTGSGLAADGNNDGVVDAADYTIWRDNLPPTATPIAGDFNSDGSVNNGDYDVWRSSYGQTGSGLAADGNHDGVVDAADYTIWRDNFDAQPLATALTNAGERISESEAVEESPKTTEVDTSPASRLAAWPSEPTPSGPTPSGPTPSGPTIVAWQQHARFTPTNSPSDWNAKIDLALLALYVQVNDSDAIEDEGLPTPVREGRGDGSEEAFANYGNGFDRLLVRGLRNAFLHD